MAISKGYLAAIIVIVLAGGALGGYLYWNSTQIKTSDVVIKVGATVSMTGKYQTEGLRVLNGYKMAVNEINNGSGVVIGNTRYNIKLIVYDDQSSATKAGQLYDTLINNDKVNILLGPYSSGIVKAVAPKAEAAKIPFIQAGGASDSIYTQGYKYTFGLYRKASLYSQPLFQWLNESTNVKQIKTAAIFLEDSSFPLSVEPAVETYLKNAGITLVNNKAYKYSSGDLNAVGTDMGLLKSAGGADLIVTVGHYADAAEVVKQVSAQSLTPKAIFGTVGPAESAFATELGAKANHVLGFAQWVPNIPEAQAPGITNFVKSYKQLHNNETPAYHAAGGYSAVYVLKAAIEKAGTFTDGLKVRDTLTKLNIKTVWGTVSFTSTGLITGSGFMTQVQNGVVETVYPLAYKTANIVFPM